LFRPLPYPESDRLVRVYELHQGAPLLPGDPQLANTTMYAWQHCVLSADANRCCVPRAGVASRCDGSGGRPERGE